MIKKYIIKTYDNFLDNILNDAKFIELVKGKIPIYEIIDLIKEYKNDIIHIIINAYEESYMIWYGIRYNAYNSIYSDAEAIICNNFENKFIKIIMKLNFKITSNKEIYTELNKNIKESAMCNIYDINLERCSKTKKWSKIKPSDILLKTRRISNDIISINTCDSDIVIKDFQSDSIIKYIIDILLKGVEIQIKTYYNSNYSGYISHLISNMLIKYFTIKYDKNTFNIFKGDFFKEDAFKNNKDISDQFDKIIDLYKCKQNYQQYNIYYTWNDFIKIINYFESNYIIPTNTMNINITPPSIILTDIDNNNESSTDTIKNKKKKK